MRLNPVARWLWRHRWLTRAAQAVYVGVLVVCLGVAAGAVVWIVSG